MDIYVGSRDVTSQFNSFFTQSGVELDGDFEGNKEVQAYTQALTAVRNALKNAVPPEGIDGQTRQEAKAAIDARFQVYTDLLKSDCEGKFEALQIIQGLYEELTQFIESGAFDSIPSAMKQKIVALQAECFSRLEQRGTHRGVPLPEGEETGTLAELPAFNPKTEPFEAYPAVLVNVTAVEIDSVDGQCVVNQGNAAEDSPVIYGSEGVHPHPFTGAAVNMDFRYETHERPTQPSSQSQAGQPQPEPTGDDLDLGLNSTDPLAGLE